MSVIAAAAMLGAVTGFAGGAGFTVWWFWQHIETAEQTPGFRRRRA